MFTKFKRKSQTLFLDPLSREILDYDKTKQVNVVLSPSLYWVKKLPLPVKYTRDVKKLLPSIFEDALVDGNYSYSAYKSDEEFFVFAYEDKKILTLLSENGISTANISSVHFAQSELVNTDETIKINTMQSVCFNNDILIIVPSEWSDSTKELDSNMIELSKHTINLQQYGHIVKTSSLYKIGAILVTLICMGIIETLITSYKVNAITEAKDEIFSKYKLQSTTLQNKSTRSRYLKTHNIQSKLREYMSYFISMRLPPSQKITLIDYKNGVLSVTFSGIAKGSESYVLSVLHAKKINFKKLFTDKNMKVEIKL